MNVAAPVMVMSDRDRPVTVPIRVGIGDLFRRYMDMSRMMIVSRVMVVGCGYQGDSGPIGCMGEVVLRLRLAMEVHGRQEGDAKTDADVA